MAQKANSLAHTKWLCKYHIVFTPKYRRKAIYNQYRKDLGEILRRLCMWKGVEIIEGHWSGQGFLDNYLSIFRRHLALSRKAPYIRSWNATAACCSRVRCI